MAPFVEILTKQLVMINDYLIDCSLSEEHSYESEITEFPVESGSTITDNIRPKPLEVTMECLVSNTPMGQLAEMRRAGQRIGEPDEAYQAMLAIRAAREPVVIRTSLATFTNMAMKSLSIPRESGRGDELRFTVTFQQIQIVSNRRTVPAGANIVNRGNCTGKKGKPVRYLWRKATPPGGPWNAGTVYGFGDYRRVVTDPQEWVLYTPSNPTGLQFEHENRLSRKLEHNPLVPGGNNKFGASLSDAELAAFTLDMQRDARAKAAAAAFSAPSTHPGDKEALEKRAKLQDAAAKAALASGNGAPLTRGPATATKPPNVSLGKPTGGR